MLRFEDTEIELGCPKESYHFDSRNPVVENGTLEDDQTAEILLLMPIITEFK
jgi:tRNA nucleotidyltransferase (CCA-adding enzyme)